MLSPLIGIANTSQSDFSNLWRKVRLVGESMGFNENNYRQCLPLILNSDMLDIFEIHKDKSLETILLKLAEVHGTSRLENKIEEITLFERKSNESLAACMGRYDVLLCRTEQAYPAEERSARRQLELINKLRSVCSEEAKSFAFFTC